MCGSLRNRLAIVAETVSGKFQATPDPLWSEYQVDRSAELVWYQVADCAHPIAACARGDDWGSADLLPFEDQMGAHKRQRAESAAAVVDRSLINAKLRTALDVRQNPETFIIGRTDAYGPLGLDEAIRRAEGFLALGVDGVFIAGMKHTADYERVGAALRGSFLSAAMFEGAGHYPHVQYPDRVERTGGDQRGAAHLGQEGTGVGRRGAAHRLQHLHPGRLAEVVAHGGQLLVPVGGLHTRVGVVEVLLPQPQAAEDAGAEQQPDSLAVVAVADPVFGAEELLLPVPEGRPTTP